MKCVVAKCRENGLQAAGQQRNGARETRNRISNPAGLGPAPGNPGSDLEPRQWPSPIRPLLAGGMRGVGVWCGWTCATRQSVA